MSIFLNLGVIWTRIKHFKLLDLRYPSISFDLLISPRVLVYTFPVPEIAPRGRYESRDTLGLPFDA